MPRGDRSGPAGQGPMTGRRLGYCAGYASPGFTRGMGAGMGRGYGNGWGFGRGGRGMGGYGWETYPSVAPGAVNRETEINTLQSETRSLQERLNGLLNRLEALTAQKPKEE